MRGIYMNLTNIDILALANKNDILALDGVQDFMNRALETEIRERHKLAFEGTNFKPQKISAPNPDSKNPMWQTYVYDSESGKLKRIQCKTKDALFDRLGKLYLDNYNTGKVLPSPKSFWDEFYKWRMSDESIKISTVNKDCDMWNKYIKDAKLFDKPVDKISRRDIQKWFDASIVASKMRAQEISAVRFILRNLFEFAIDHNYIKANPVENISSKGKARQQKDNNDPHRLFTKEEYFKLKDYFWNKFYEDRSSHQLAVLFTMGLALRSGELTALRWDDVITENGITKIYCRRKESKHYTDISEDGASTCGYEITQHCKKHSDRLITLDDDLVHVLECQKDLGYDNNGFIFGDGTRMTSRQLSYQYEKACKDLGILERRNHTMRRTVASILYDAGVNPTYIQHLLGHKSLAMTLKYIGRVAPEMDDRTLATMALKNNHQESPKIAVA